MIQRASLFLSLVLLTTSACTSSAPAEIHVGERLESQLGERLERLTRRTKGELRAKAERHRDREELRAAGKRVCEEGDWPQRWGEGCRTCWCDVMDVRSCNLRLRCPASEWDPETGTPSSKPSVDGVESEVGKRLEKLTRRTMAELELRARVREIRENLRAAGGRVCEEDDWPQEWWDGCQWCWCGESQIRQCETGHDCDPEVERKLQKQLEGYIREGSTYYIQRNTTVIEVP